MSRNHFLTVLGPDEEKIKDMYKKRVNKSAFYKICTICRLHSFYESSSALASCHTNKAQICSFRHFCSLSKFSWRFGRAQNLVCARPNSLSNTLNALHERRERREDFWHHFRLKFIFVFWGNISEHRFMYDYCSTMVCKQYFHYWAYMLHWTLWLATIIPIIGSESVNTFQQPSRASWLRRVQKEMAFYLFNKQLTCYLCQCRVG